MSTEGSGEIPDVEFHPLTYGDRYFVHTAKNSIVGIVQILGEAVSNADEAITRRSMRDGKLDRGEIHVHYTPDGAELVIIDSGDGMTASIMEYRLRNVGADPQADAKRAFFHRGIREVFLAMGGGEIASVGRDGDGRMVLSHAIFDPSRGMGMLTRDRPITRDARTSIGVLAGTGTRVTIPMARFADTKPREFEFGAIEAALRDCVQIRPVMMDPNRKILLHYAGEQPRRVKFEYPRGVELVDEVELQIGDQPATMWARVAPKPLAGGRSRQTRHYGILVRGDRAAYEVSLGDKLRMHPAMQRVYGEIRVNGIEDLQREADRHTDDEHMLVYQPDRSGLNAEHPLVEKIGATIDSVLLPLVSKLEDAGGDTKRVTPDMRRQLQKLAKLINHMVREEKQIGDAPDAEGGKRAAGVEGIEDPGDDGTAGSPPPQDAEPEAEATGPSLPDAVRFAQNRLFVDAGQSRKVKVLFADSLVEATVELVHRDDAIVTEARLSDVTVPESGELDLTIEAGSAEGRHALSVAVKVGDDEFVADMAVHVRFPRASGFISQIVPHEIDNPTGSALWDPATGVVTVFTGRREFKDAERSARLHKADPWKFPPYRQLVVESVREAALGRAAERRAEVLWDDLSAAEQREPMRFHELVSNEFMALDYELRPKLHRTFMV